MKIDDGYNNKPLNIHISKSNGNNAEFWIHFESKDVKNEMLSYATIQELVDLKREIGEVLRDMIGLDKP